jgi:hypothetical protein
MKCELAVWMKGSFIDKPALVMLYGTTSESSSQAVGQNSPDLSNTAGHGARMLAQPSMTKVLLHSQQKIDWSSVVFRISSCSRRKARDPSPYRRGMLMSKMPSMQYAISSIRVVIRFDIQDIRFATLAIQMGFEPVSIGLDSGNL